MLMDSNKTFHVKTHGEESKIRILEHLTKISHKALREITLELILNSQNI